MAEMTQEEMVQEVLDRVLQSSTGVEDLETVTSLNGVKSLPGEKDGKMVNVPLELIGKPASDAAARAEAAAKKAEGAVSGLEEKTQAAMEAASKANEAAGKAEHAAAKVESTTVSAMKGATVRFSGFVDQVTTEISSATQAGGAVVYARNLNQFVYRYNGKYYTSWMVNGVPGMGMYKDENGVLRDKVYIYGNSLYTASFGRLTLFAHRHEVMSESDYEAMELKDGDTIYLTYEEE